MNTEDFVKVCQEIVKDLKRNAPRDTGNLAENSIRIEFLDNGNTCKIYVDERIAPYMPFTNEPWISPRWNGKKNPNEQWWNNSSEKLAEDIATYTGGTLIREEL